MFIAAPAIIAVGALCAPSAPVPRASAMARRIWSGARMAVVDCGSFADVGGAEACEAIVRAAGARMALPVIAAVLGDPRLGDPAAVVLRYVAAADGAWMQANRAVMDDAGRSRRIERPAGRAPSREALCRALGEVLPPGATLDDRELPSAVRLNRMAKFEQGE